MLRKERNVAHTASSISRTTRMLLPVFIVICIHFICSLFLLYISIRYNSNCGYYISHLTYICKMKFQFLIDW